MQTNDSGSLFTGMVRRQANKVYALPCASQTLALANLEAFSSEFEAHCGVDKVALAHVYCHEYYMQISKLYQLLTIALGAACVGAGCPPCAPRSPIRPIDHACLPAGCSPDDLPLFRQDITTPNVQIATVESFASEQNDPETVKKMLNDLKNKAQTTGADAVIRVKMLHQNLHGFVENPRTPFFSVKQDDWKRYFFHGVAVKYLDRTAREPEEVPERHLASPPILPGDQLKPEHAGTLKVSPQSVPQPLFPQAQPPSR